MLSSKIGLGECFRIHILSLIFASSNFFNSIFAFWLAIAIARLQNKADCERALAKNIKDTVGDPSDLPIRRACADRGVIDLVSKPRSRLDQMSARKEYEVLVQQCFRAGLVRTLNLWSSITHLKKQPPLHPSSENKSRQVTLMISGYSKGRKIGKSAETVQLLLFYRAL